MPKRGDRAAPLLAKASGRYASLTTSPEGWEQLAGFAPGSLLEAWEHLSKRPRSREPNPARVCQLKHDLAVREIKGHKLEQWQYEVTGAGRIWYCPDDSKMTVWIVHAGVGHPKATE